MTKIIFGFSELSTNCLHDKKDKFTNAVKLELISKITFAELFRSLQSICEKELEELLEMDHFHLVENSYIKERISKLVSSDSLYSKRILQVPLGKEVRLYGILQKVKHSDFYLFQSLLLDPNHLVYDAKRFNKLKKMTCLFSEIDCKN